MIPRLTTLTAMVIASMVTCTDPILSQAIAKGPFADKYVPRALREIISAEAGANDGFGFPFLLLATSLIRHTPVDDVDFKPDAHRIIGRSGDVGRLGGDAGKAIEIWVVGGWLYFTLLGAVIGVVIGIASMSAITFTLTRFVFSTTPSSPLAHMLICRAADGSTPSKQPKKRTSSGR
jgi:NhaP-type Na+/H+ or K+/H+ antiporter